VTWWAANFSHHHKRYRCQGWGRLEVTPAFQIRLVPTTSYRRNISLARIWFELVFAWRLYRAARGEPPPDAILATEPPQSNVFVAACLARRFGVPLMVDLNDLWPELFAIALPGWLRPAARLVFLPFYAMRRLNFRRAQAVVAVSESYLRLARSLAPHLAADRLVTVYTGCNTGAPQPHPPAGQQDTPARRLNKPPGEVWAAYAGGLGDNYDVQTMLGASLRLADMRSPVRIVVAGAGPAQEAVLNFEREHPNARLRFLGKLDPAELNGLYEHCEIAISAYAPGSTVTMPTKIFDYLAAGLPMVNSLPGEAREFIQRHGLGRPYTAGDPASLALALDGLATDPAARAAMSANCLRLAPDYDSRRQYARIGALLQTLTGSPSPGISPDAALSVSGS
jgi:glycosyltransferase involved in cell wall biosynthesis